MKSRPRIRSAEDLFGAFEVSDRDFERYRQMIADGKLEEAIDEFLAKYIGPVTDDYSDALKAYLQSAAEGQFSREDQKSVESSVVALTAALAFGLEDRFSRFVKKVIGPQIFSEVGISSPDVKSIILQQTLARFESLTRGTLAATESTILEHIRTLQKEMIVANQRFAAANMVANVLEREEDAFRRNLQARFPDIFKAMEDGKIIRSVQGDQVRHWRLRPYSEMATRTTLLNVERTAVEVKAGIDENEVVEFYKSDTRSVKEPREICQSILGRRISGKAYLAMTPEAAGALGIMTIDDARAAGAFGPHCRHSIHTTAMTAEKLKEAGSQK